jgi:hypothetical protein
MNPDALYHIEIVIEAGTLFREFYLRSTLPAVTEADLIFIQRCTESPHTSKNKECFIYLLDFVFFLIFSQTLHVISFSLV